METQQLEAMGYVHEAAGISAQSWVHSHLTLAQIKRESAERSASEGRKGGSPRLSPEVRIARVAAPFHRLAEALFEKLSADARRQAGLVRLALETWDHRERNEELWQIALVSIGQQLKNLATVRRGFAEVSLPAMSPKTQAFARRLVWPKELEARYVILTDDLDDLMETLALGLNPEMRAQIDAALAETPQP